MLIMNMILGKKLAMTRIFDKDNNTVPVTLVSAKPCVVIDIKTTEKNGYNAIVLALTKEKGLPKKPQQSIYKNANVKNVENTKEFKVSEEFLKDIKIGDQISIDKFEINETVEVVGTSKGKGFAGVMKRHGFHGMPASHGHEKQRIPGSIGCRFPQRTVKGKRMAGHMGVDRVTIKNTQIIDIDKENNIIAIKGPIPGPNKSLIQIKTK